MIRIATMRTKIEKLSGLVKSGEYFDIINRFLSYYIPTRYIIVNKSNLLWHKGEEIKLKRRPKIYQFRKAVPADLYKIIECTDKNSTQRRYENYRMFFDRGGFCYVVEHNDKVVGYCWAFLGKYLLTFDAYQRTDYTLELNASSTFLGDGFILPTYRLRGIYPFLIGGIIEHLKENYQIKNYYASVEYNNPHSFKSHQRLGFKYIGTYYFLKLFNQGLFYTAKEKCRFKLLKTKTTKEHIRLFSDQKEISNQSYLFPVIDK